MNVPQHTELLDFRFELSRRFVSRGCVGVIHASGDDDVAVVVHQPHPESFFELHGLAVACTHVRESRVPHVICCRRLPTCLFLRHLVLLLSIRLRRVT